MSIRNPQDMSEQTCTPVGLYRSPLCTRSKKFSLIHRTILPGCFFFKNNSSKVKRISQDFFCFWRLLHWLRKWWLKAWTCYGPSDPFKYSHYWNKLAHLPVFFRSFFRNAVGHFLLNFTPVSHLFFATGDGFMKRSKCRSFTVQVNSNHSPGDGTG